MTTTASPIAALRLALRRAGREQNLANLRAGRRQRSVVIPSGKTYKRRDKHVHNDKEQ
ncbi:MAG: hypothetical protein V4510_13130 [bacterium]